MTESTQILVKVWNSFARDLRTGAVRRYQAAHHSTSKEAEDGAYVLEDPGQRYGMPEWQRDVGLE